MATTGLDTNAEARGHPGASYPAPLRCRFCDSRPYAEANELPIAVAGPTARAWPLLHQLGDVKLVKVSNAATAARAVRSRDAYGAIIASPQPSIDVASGASFVFATSLRQTAAEQGIPLDRIDDLAPLPAGDPRGVVLNLTVLALLITSITGAALHVVYLPRLRLGTRLALAAGTATAAGLGTTTILDAAGALAGSFLAATGVVALLIFTVALFAGAVVRLRGPAGTSLALMFFLVLANPGSGLASAPDLLRTPWKQLGPLMPPGAAGQALRGALYFGNAKILAPLLILAGWATLAVILHALADRRDVSSPTKPELATATAAPPSMGERSSSVVPHVAMTATGHLNRPRQR